MTADKHKKAQIQYKYLWYGSSGRERIRTYLRNLRQKRTITWVAFDTAESSVPNTNLEQLLLRRKALTKLSSNNPTVLMNFWAPQE